MTKTTIAITLISFMIFTGCAGNLEEKQPQVIQENTTFENKMFSLKLPAPYTEHDGVIQPENEKDFPEIIFTNLKEDVDLNKLFEFEKEWFKALWSQTGPAEKFINNEIVTINGKNGVKYTIQYPGRSLEDTTGYLNELHYSILHNGNLFRFWSSVSDLEKPEETSKVFDKIIETVSFE